VTWLIVRLCRISHSFTSRFQICDPTNICWVAIENPHISHTIRHYCAAIQQILIWSQIWNWEVEERSKLHNLHIHYVTIRSEPKNLIAAEVATTIKWNCSPVPTLPKTRQFMSGQGNNPGLVDRFMLLRSSQSEPGSSVQFQPGPKPGNPQPLLTLVTNCIWDKSGTQGSTKPFSAALVGIWGHNH